MSLDREETGEGLRRQALPASTFRPVGLSEAAGGNCVTVAVTARWSSASPGEDRRPPAVQRESIEESDSSHSRHEPARSHRVERATSSHHNRSSFGEPSLRPRSPQCRWWRASGSDCTPPTRTPVLLLRSSSPSRPTRPPPASKPPRPPAAGSPSRPESATSSPTPTAMNSTSSPTLTLSRPAADRA